MNFSSIPEMEGITYQSIKTMKCEDDIKTGYKTNYEDNLIVLSSTLSTEIEWREICCLGVSESHL